MKKLFIVLAIMSQVSYADILEDIKMDFDSGMGVIEKRRYALLFQGKDAKEKMDMFRQIYQKPNLSKVGIPKIIHQIWLGPEKVPLLYQTYSQEWKRIHPNWQYKLWTEEEIKNWDFENKDLFLKASSYQEKSDILRYEILRKFGGLYIDMDYVPLRNFDALSEKFEFFASLEPGQTNHDSVVVSNAIIGSSPNHPVFNDVFLKIRNHWDLVESKFQNREINTTSIVMLAVERTMKPLTKSVMLNINPEKDSAILLPPPFLMPIFPSTDYDFFTKIKIKLRILPRENLFKKKLSFSYAFQDFNDKRIVQKLNF